MRLDRAAHSPMRPTPLSQCRNSSSLWGLDGLHELPDLEKLQDAGLLSKADALTALGAPQPQEET